MEAQPVAPPTEVLNEEEAEYVPPDEAEHEEQELAERRRKQLEQEAAQRDTVRACGCPRTPALPDLSPP
eukprot:SAG31_NODE_2044_length_6580_cov_2.757445_2_plen_69_part_00